MTVILHPEIQQGWDEIRSELEGLVRARTDLTPELRGALLSSAAASPCTPALLAFVVNETLHLERSKVLDLSVSTLMIARGTAIAADPEADAMTLLAADALLTWGLSLPSGWEWLSEEARLRVTAQLSGGGAFHQAVAEALFVIAAAAAAGPPSRELRKNVLNLAETMDQAVSH